MPQQRPTGNRFSSTLTDTGASTPAGIKYVIIIIIIIIIVVVVAVVVVVVVSRHAVFNSRMCSGMVWVETCRFIVNVLVRLNTMQLAYFS